ncbi:MAG: carbamoyltransferase HypF [Nitrospirae bacterium]|nr:carbamoyltransferase HypF [Nitrospirota bacterium]
MDKKRVKIFVKGIVQGVGFRPFVYNLAESLKLKGYVINSSKGVTIEIEGNEIESFIQKLKNEAPPLSQILSIETIDLPYHGYKDFRIEESKDEGSFTLISPDVSICNDCLNEMLDRNDRRYLYPFINCTNCGPRYTITKCVPYDRPNTTMSVFKMCTACSMEYHDPRNRRFHAQPNACPVCGPQVQLLYNNSRIKVKQQNSIKQAIELLKKGKIIAVKGLGGFHIACDANNKNAVERLRKEKRKNNKPFALMAPDIETIKKYCYVTAEEEEILKSNKRPIVLLNKKVNKLPEAIAPNNPGIGFMLPYTPLHYLLFYYPISETDSDKKSSPNFDALVMTSGNISEEPIVTDNKEAMEKLSGIVDAFLIHNRDIFMRVDDSVIRVISDKSTLQKLKVNNNPIIYFIRRSRGFVPDPVELHEEGPEVLGCGADMKNIFTLTKGSFAIPSQHIGDMENYETLQFFEESLNNLKTVYRVNPVALAYDLHPMYLSTQWALRQKNIKKIPIQHHYAHVASIMAEKGFKNKVIGVSFDGTGYGTDGNLWGGEFLIADIKGFERAGHIKYIPLPGGEKAVKEPWRIAVSYVRACYKDKTLSTLKSIGFADKYGIDNINSILTIINNTQFSPLSSGAGRLFDAVSALTGICDKNTFEGEAAIALEASVSSDIKGSYPVNLELKNCYEIDFSPAILHIINDLNKNMDKGIISAKFHNTVVKVIIDIVSRLSEKYSIYDIALCGGVFQNMYLLYKTIEGLSLKGMKVHIHDKVPTNDAGISLGQAYIIRERIKSGIE